MGLDLIFFSKKVPLCLTTGFAAFFGDRFCLGEFMRFCAEDRLAIVADVEWMPFECGHF